MPSRRGLILGFFSVIKKLSRYRTELTMTCRQHKYTLVTTPTFSTKQSSLSVITQMHLDVCTHKYTTPVINTYWVHMWYTTTTKLEVLIQLNIKTQMFTRIHPAHTHPLLPLSSCGRAHRDVVQYLPHNYDDKLLIHVVTVKFFVFCNSHIHFI